MTKRTRQYLGLLAAIVVYYLLHEGAHLFYALLIGVFKKINFIGLGIQIDVYAERMSDTQMGIFCLSGAIVTLLAAYVLICLTGLITRSSSKLFMACSYYVTIALLLLDPLYLSVLCSFFGGGDMNGISLLFPEVAARIVCGVILIVNAFVFWKFVLSKYTNAFADNNI